MSINDVLAAVRWWDLSVGSAWGTLPDNSGSEFIDADKTAIRGYLTTAYSSPVAQAILEQAAATGQISCIFA